MAKKALELEGDERARGLAGGRDEGKEVRFFPYHSSLSTSLSLTLVCRGSAGRARRRRVTQ
jgi:hypothetical protein